MSKQIHRGAEQWYGFIENQNQSELKIAEFCR
ncbi:hypothetical protein SAMN05216420_102307 [Nitrosospira sp. Nl5]|nr:hypothetical protein SAMN05216420_102307 [Nitrosospira sp. Nl5]